MSSREQIDSVIDDDDEFWYVLFVLTRYASWLTRVPPAPYA